jgi:hypothetical protein
LSIKETTLRLAVLGLKPLFQGTGFAREQIPTKGSPILPGRFVQVNFSPSLTDDAKDDESEGESVEGGDTDQSGSISVKTQPPSKADEKKAEQKKIKVEDKPKNSTNAAAMEAPQNEIRD